MNKTTIIAALDKLTCEELGEVIKAAQEMKKVKSTAEKESVKVEKETAKVTREQEVGAAIAAKLITVGVVIKYKTADGVIHEQKVEKVGEKTFTVDVGMIEGKKTSKRYIKFAQVIGFVDNTPKADVEPPKAILHKKGENAEAIAEAM